MKDYANGEALRSPIEFFDPEKKKNYNYSPIIFEEDRINSQDNYAILKTTANGKYVRGNMLFYKFNGVEIYTDINNIILVDVLNSIVFIRQYSNTIEQFAPNDPEQKHYIILYVEEGYEEDDLDTPLRWESYVGRMYAYRSLLSHLPVIDIDKSMVLVDNVPLKDSLSVRKFLEYLRNADLVDPNDFDLEGYYYAEDD